MYAAMRKRQTAAVSLCLSSPPIHSQIHVLFQAAMKELRMAVTAVQITINGFECVGNRSDGQMITQQLDHYIRLKKMINTTNFQGLDCLPVNSQFITWGLDQFVKRFDATDRKQLREEQQADKELILIETKFFEKGHQRLTEAVFICQF
ncbi:MAG: hypothetical protein EZS28_010307 [Streblomastix strix]|uniref:Uncharacterized protein n=1 Tax=Streblomastix strix TaxID=222440 RepID=A0A5J4WHK6_9EUKA|nr:MAG: hypothetical protein EZS28_010307 [Streblomastix strix]